MLGFPAAAQGMVADGVKETNCLAGAGENLQEQMAQSVFSLLLLPSEWEKSECFRGWSNHRLTSRCWTLSGTWADAIAWGEGMEGGTTRRDGTRCHAAGVPSAMKRGSSGRPRGQL